MTVSTLLAHFGVNVPRYVTMNGEIVFNNVVPESGGGYFHSTHGRVTAVPDHTFHGGPEEADSELSGPARWWDDEVQIMRHVEAMKKAFPNFAYLPASDDLNPCWIGDINTGRGKFRVGVVLRSDKKIPSVTLLNSRRLGAHAGRRWQRSPHLYDNNNPCVASCDDWDPEDHTVATATAWAAHWLAAYTEWRISRKWPVEGCQTVAT
ncbi:hypothetical protein [Nocardiopsis aegyptia]|uniref:Type II CBASS E2 protein domain-containing protein n=1 Tax=Nocardiopsis aegyptia TaxID=220378 RepID=A0A7Z0EKJ0_9ACTN|nr:hypothetical protein [Nocardiopsis aegyptia]NYJ33686.1 hypothetical protein [Nocardiopsis aegyptia]